MSMNLKEVVSWLAEEGYLVMHKNMYLLTAKFNREMTGKDIGIQVIDKPKVQQVEPKVDWVGMYQKLIIESGMPRMSDNGRGGQYQINAATKPGREAFKKAIQSGTTYETLLERIKNYYGETKSYLVKIEKFFVDEMWRNQTTTTNGTIKPKFF